MKVRQLIALLEADGWHLARMKGSHRQFRHSSKPGTVTVAGKSNVEVPPGTLNSVLKRAGLKKPG
jgi:predicted RNA binding protein YcfA (HicA-like mRNA interferase family)